jgi:mannosyltransferase
MSSVFFNQLPEGLIAYNNFEISHSSIWKHSKWLEFINYIGSTGGIYTKRWGDAPIHTLGISLILNKSEVHRFVDIGYRHDPFVNQKPSGLPKPSADPFLDESVNCFFYER